MQILFILWMILGLPHTIYIYIFPFRYINISIFTVYPDIHISTYIHITISAYTYINISAYKYIFHLQGAGRVVAVPVLGPLVPQGHVRPGGLRRASWRREREAGSQGVGRLRWPCCRAIGRPFVASLPQGARGLPPGVRLSPFGLRRGAPWGGAVEGLAGTVSLEGAAPSGAALVGRCPVLWANAVVGLAPVAEKGGCLWETKGNGQVWLPWGVVLFRVALPEKVRDSWGLRTSDGGKGRKGWPCRGALCVLAVG